MSENIITACILTVGVDAEVNGKATQDALNKVGCETVMISGCSKSDLDSAQFLFIVADSAERVDDSDTESAWKYFLDEVKWKRKSFGEVVLIDSSQISFAPSRLPYALKKCKRFRLTQLADAAAYIVKRLDENSGAANTSAVLQSTVANTAATVSNTAASAANKATADEKSFSLKRESGACKEDHVFEESPRKTRKSEGGKTYIRDVREEHSLSDNGEVSADIGKQSVNENLHDKERQAPNNQDDVDEEDIFDEYQDDVDDEEVFGAEYEIEQEDNEAKGKTARGQYRFFSLFALAIFAVALVFIVRTCLMF